MSRTYKTGESAEKLLLREDQAVYNARAKDALPKLRTVFKLVDLFCGAGGMTLGFTEDFGHHFKSVWANDFNKYCVDTYTANFGSHCLPGDIVDIMKDPSVTIPRADVVIGGPHARVSVCSTKRRRTTRGTSCGGPFLRLWRDRAYLKYRRYRAVINGR